MDHVKHVCVDDTSTAEEIDYAISDLCEHLNSIDMCSLGLGMVDEYKAMIDELMGLRTLRYNAKRRDKV